MEILEIKSSYPYPSNMLSNFYPHSFIIDDVKCKSMEGFLQSLKFKDIKIQKQVCLCVGIDAKKRGKRKFLWKLTGNIYWKGRKIKRKSKEFQALIDRAYNELLKNEEFKKALSDSEGYLLAHSIGKNNQRRTILTEKEFLSRLNKLRNISCNSK